MALTERRANKFDRVLRNRQCDLSILLENVHDKHNIGAVLRTCDSVGIADVYILYTMEGLTGNYFKVGQRSSSGALKWVRTHFFSDREACFTALREKYDNIIGTHLDDTSVSLYDLDLVKSTVLVFGNEHTGISEASLPYLDGNFTIPQFGMVQSLNISVACAVSLYEASRQRLASGCYENTTEAKTKYQQELKEYYAEINKTREREIFMPRK